MKTKYLTRNDLESVRAQVFHTTLIGLAWAMIGEFAVSFRDYAAVAILLLGASVFLAFRSVEIYEQQDDLPDPEIEGFVEGLSRKKRHRFYVIAFMFEAAAIMATWEILCRLSHRNWLIPGFALIAGLHFIPLAKVFKSKSYYLLGGWICMVATIGYLFPVTGQIFQAARDGLIAYGCAIGAILDGVWIIAETKKALRKQRFRIWMRKFP